MVAVYMDRLGPEGQGQGEPFDEKNTVKFWGKLG